MLSAKDAIVTDNEGDGYFYTYNYPRPAVTVDLIVVAEQYNDESHMLFVRRGKEPYKGKLALPGGFLNMNETGKEAAVREFKEECSADLPYGCIVELFTVADMVDRDTRGRVISLVHSAMFEGKPFVVTGSDDAVEAVWLPVSSVLEEDLAFDHGDILRLFIDQHAWLVERCGLCNRTNCMQCPCR